MKKIPIRHINSGYGKPPSAGRFTIRRVEEIMAGKDLKHDHHRHDFFFVLVLQKGKGVHEIDFTSYDAVDNSVFLLRPGQTHQLELKTGCTGFLMEFNNEFYHPGDKASGQRLRKASNKNFCQLDETRLEKLMTVLDYMFQETIAMEEGWTEIIKANLEIFFIELLRQSSHPKNTTSNINSYAQERLEEFLELLETYIFTHKQVSQYTEMMNLSSYQLNEITKSTIGKTASALLTERIILEAKRYLLATPNQVKDIADLLGYEDVSYFIRFFKKQTGHTPELFRQYFA